MQISDARVDDARWRFENLYQVSCEETGELIPFRPRPWQNEIFDAVHERGEKSILILKSRRLGMSTAIDIMGADRLNFARGAMIQIVDQSDKEATKKLNNIVKPSALPIAEALGATIDRENDHLIQISAGGDHPSEFWAGSSARGGTTHFLHVSEFGPIQFRDATRAEEIVTGALPAARAGVKFIETTWKGRKGGHLWNFTKTAMETPDEYKGPHDWRVYFFPWWDDPMCLDNSNPEQLTLETKEYFEELSQLTQKQFSDAQMVWYQKAKQIYGLFIYNEFPSTIEECWKAPVEGAIYQHLVDRARTAGQIAPLIVDGAEPVHTFWDLGAPENTAIWYVQLVGDEIRLVDYDQGYLETTVERVARMRAKGYNLGLHYLPHDGAALQKGGKSYEQELNDAGFTDTRIIPRTYDVWIGINRMSQLFPRIRIDNVKCENGLECLENYHRRKDERKAFLRDEPVHDWSSHGCDAFRMIGEAEMAGLLEGRSSTARSIRRLPKVVSGFRG